MSRTGNKVPLTRADLSSRGCKKALAQRSLGRSACAARHLKPSTLAEVQLNTRIASDRKEIDKMRASLRLIVTLSLLVIGAPRAYAQARVPASGMWGVGGS